MLFGVAKIINNIIIIKSHSHRKACLQPTLNTVWRHKPFIIITRIYVSQFFRQLTELQLTVVAKVA